MNGVPGIILEKLAAITGSKKEQLKITRTGGGSINETFRTDAGRMTYFCKINSASKFPQLFLKEKNGLEALSVTGCIYTPEIVDHGEAGPWQYLLLEYIEEGQRTPAFWQQLGKQLATLHRQGSGEFGWREDNYMGSVPQRNDLSKNWDEFFISRRLEPMVKSCFDQNLLQSKHVLAFENLYSQVPGLFSGEAPALLHGDLWSGNFMCGQNSRPVLIDPAVYYGHRSMDLAMTTLFGGFHQDFYTSYHEYYPLPVNYKEQWEICNLYPLLIHLYLFGRSYLSKVETRLIAYGL